MFNRLTEAEIRQACKERIESLETWLRRLIHEKFMAAYGNQYFTATENGRRIIKNEIVKNVTDRLSAEPRRYSRPVDALQLDETTRIICRKDLYDLHFCEALKTAFPQGNAVALTFLSRLYAPRNKLSHANPISDREAEQVICYSNDIIDSLKTYYIEIGMEKEYNAPSIARIVDSFGNDMHREFDAIQNRNPNSYLWLGDQLTLRCEVDAAFSPEQYKICWLRPIGMMMAREIGQGNTLSLIADVVTVQYTILCRVVSNKKWHRHGKWDDTWALHYKVLPPNETTT